jgi:uncharacterized membrane protein YuzA (DUF378 family)
MNLLNWILWLLLVVVVVGCLNYGSIAVWGPEKGDMIAKVCSKTGKSGDCKRVIQGTFGLAAIGLFGAALAHASLAASKQV